MSETPPKKQDFLDLAKHQFAQISAEFEKALDALKDPERRRHLTSSYLDMLQKGLSKAQESIGKYQDKFAPEATVEAPTVAADSPTAVPPTADTPDLGKEDPQESTN
jgi:hypothetical protein